VGKSTVSMLVMDGGETPRSDFPDFHGLLHGAPLSTCAGGRSWALQPGYDAGTNSKQGLPLHFQQCLHKTSTEDIESNLELAGEKRTESRGRSWETE